MKDDPALLLPKATIREALSHDVEALWKFLAIAADEPDIEAARSTPIVASHLHGWPRPGDFGVIAECSGTPVGAAWARQFSQEESPTYFVAADIPEVSIGVSQSHRGKGVGHLLLVRLEEAAMARGIRALCLNVRDTNPALRLYERVGYRLIPGTGVPNRVGGHSFGMVRTVPRPDVIPVFSSSWS